MRNLTSYKDDAFIFFNDVLDGKNTTKKDPNYKDRILVLMPAIREYFTEYDALFEQNNLHKLSCANYEDNTKKDLLSLYAYKRTAFQKLKNLITTSELNRIINTCQNCTINEINSFDHIVPKEEFSEFSVHPKNLFPSCTKCNGHKSTVWREDSKVVFLNLYLDQLPSTQYLFAKPIISNRKISVEFTVSNNNGIEKELFQKIKNHYEKLELCERFKDNIDSVISPLKNTIASFKNDLPLERIIEISIETSKKNMIAFGTNYWKSILEMAFLNDSVFMTQFQ